MKNKKGYTLVELLVVITLIGLLVVIAVPSGIAISKKVKQKMLDSKIELIESGAIVWGQQNKSEIKNGSNCINNTGTEITSCVKKDISEMLNEENALEEDYIEESTSKKHLKNPVTEESMNACSVEIYIKNKRVYAKYDNSTCETSD